MIDALPFSCLEANWFTVFELYVLDIIASASEGASAFDQWLVSTYWLSATLIS